MDRSSHLPIGTSLGNYELTAFLGEGGMGTVYSAVHRGLGKRVAIKTLRSDLAAQPELRARFLREGKAAAAVRHPNVVDVDDVGIAGDTPYLVMELLEGEDLRARVLRQGRLRVDETVVVLLPALLALSEAHRAGVVHRDLKPDNIFLSRTAHDAVVPKLLDFGISKLRETQSMSLTGNHTVLGTPFYMSPEQASSARETDARSDLYSMGVILYYCTVGRVPFGGSQLAQVIGQIMLADPVPLRETCPEVPAGFEAVVLRCMAKDPAARYQDALSLASALLPFASSRVQLRYGPVLQPASHGDTQAGPGSWSNAPRGGGSDQTPPPLARSVAPRGSTQPPGNSFVRYAAVAMLLTSAVLGVLLLLRPKQPDPQPPASAAADSAPKLSVPPPPAADPVTELPSQPGGEPQRARDAGTAILPVVPIGVRRPHERPRERDKTKAPKTAPPPSAAPQPNADPVWDERR
jgi:serine/threonine protein kinase